MKPRPGPPIGLLALFGASLFGLYVIFKPFLTAFAWACFLAAAFFPLYRALLRWFHGRKWWASAATTVLLTSLLVIPTIHAVSSLADSVADLTPKIQSALRSAMTPAPAAEPAPTTLRAKVRTKLTAVLHRFDLSTAEIKSLSVEASQKVGKIIAGQATSLLQNVLQTAVTVVVTLILLLFLFVHTEDLAAALRSLLPLAEPDKKAVLERLRNVLRAIFFGVMVTALIQALLGTLGWWAVGLASPVLFGFLMFFAALIPLVGPSVILVPGAIWLFWTGATLKGVLLFVWAIGVVGMVENFLKPLLIGGKSGLPMVLVLFGIIGGLSAFGMTGLFLGPMILTVFLFLLEVLRRDLQSREAS